MSIKLLDYIQNYKEVTYNYKNTITEYPVENVGKITDHIYNEFTTIKISFVAGLGYGGKSKTPKNLLQDILQWNKNKEVIVFGSFGFCLIDDFTYKLDSTNTGILFALEGEITLKSVITTTVKSGLEDLDKISDTSGNAQIVPQNPDWQPSGVTIEMTSNDSSFGTTLIGLGDTTEIVLTQTEADILENAPYNGFLEFTAEKILTVSPIAPLADRVPLQSDLGVQPVMDKYYPSWRLE